MGGEPLPVSKRALAILHAVSAGRARRTCSCEPDLFIDGLACCDQMMAHFLVHAKLIRPEHPALSGLRVAARLTSAGHAMLAAPPEAA